MYVCTRTYDGPRAEGPSYVSMQHFGGGEKFYRGMQRKTLHKHFSPPRQSAAGPVLLSLSIFIIFTQVPIYIFSRMVSDMSYSTVSQVLESWESVRRKENYEEVIGTRLFQK